MQALAQLDPCMEAIEALQEMFEKHYSLVLDSAYRLTGSYADAEDVLQTVFMRLVKKTNLPELGNDSRRYLKRAAVNAALDVIRHRKVDRRVPLDSFQDNLPGRGTPQPDRLYSDSELRTWLREALVKMNPRAAESCALKYFEGYSNQEIAKSLDTTPGVIAVTLHRTRSQLQSEIQVFLGG